RVCPGKVALQIRREHTQRLAIDVVDGGGGEEQRNNPPADLSVARQVVFPPWPSPPADSAGRWRNRPCGARRPAGRCRRFSSARAVERRSPSATAPDDRSARRTSPGI